MRRREFIGLLGGVTITWPVVARAQQPAMPVIGFLSTGSPEAFAPYVASFRQGLSEIGYAEGRNVSIEFRWAGAQDERIPVLIADLVNARVTVIAGINSTAVARAAKAATSTIPIVFAIGADPVKVDLVASFNRPGGNITGVSFQSNFLLPKRLELLRELVPATEKIGFIVNPMNPNTASDVEDARAAAHTVGWKMAVLNTSSEHEFEAAFAAVVEAKAQALLMDSDPLFTRRREQIVALAARYRMPVLYDRREFVAAGGLICYGSSLANTYYQVGAYTGRILNGDKPSELPVMQPTKFELVINFKTAKMLGMTVPPSLLARADEVIE